ncbi:hypothetical protein SH467x_000361 [Pirellulaceae bacterium SH467]
MPKPWEKPSFLDGQEPEVFCPANIDGVFELIDALVRINEWRRQKWKADHPNDSEAIDTEIDSRLLRLGNIRSFVGKFSQEDHELVFALISAGMTINNEVHRWTLHAAENGISQESGRIESVKKRRVTDWAMRKLEADTLMDLHDGNKIKVAKELGISLSALENWLRGGRR